ncbi:MAG: VOC family protein [Ktedonobacteraceae bacterium]
MATQLQIVIDCSNPAQLAMFWAQALYYKVQDPPAGYTSWEAFLQARGVPQEEWNSASAVVDPDGKGPRIYFQRVPEPKAVKNRVHLDVNASRSVSSGSSPERVQKIDAEIERLKELGARELYRKEQRGEYWVTMADPEGNEFCVQ